MCKGERVGRERVEGEEAEGVVVGGEERVGGEGAEGARVRAKSVVEGVR